MLNELASPKPAEMCEILILLPQNKALAAIIFTISLKAQGFWLGICRD